jgi:hypothetical protein
MGLHTTDKRSLCRVRNYAEGEVLRQRAEYAPMVEMTHEVGIIAAG